MEIQEFANLKSQIVTSSWGGICRAMSDAFTENGMDVLSSMLNSTRTIKVHREFGRLPLVSSHRHVCILEMSRLRFPRLPDHTPETFQDAAFIRQNHRALDDARMTAKIWLKMEGG